MAKWSVALYGHYKPNYYLISKSTGEKVEEYVTHPGEIDEKVFTLHQCTGVINRAVPGDMIDFKPFELDQMWSKNERNLFLIVSIDGPTRAQMEAMCECEWNLDSYTSYTPDDLQTWYNKALLKTLTAVDIDRAQETLLTNKDAWYNQEKVFIEQDSQFPRQHWRKRRYNLSVDVLDNKGVDTTKMLDKEIEYTPDISVISPYDFYDKLKTKTISVDDKLNLIPYRSLEEMENPKTAETILTELRS